MYTYLMKLPDNELPQLDLTNEEVRLLAKTYAEGLSLISRNHANIHPLRRKANNFLVYPMIEVQGNTFITTTLDSLIEKKLVTVLYKSTSSYALTRLGVRYAKAFYIMMKI